MENKIKKFLEYLKNDNEKGYIKTIKALSDNALRKAISAAAKEKDIDTTKVILFSNSDPYIQKRVLEATLVAYRCSQAEGIEDEDLRNMAYKIASIQRNFAV